MTTPRILQSSASVEAANPGFTAVSGPYHLTHYMPCRAKEDQEALDRALADQQRLCPEAKRVNHGKKVWIVRKAPLICEADTKHRTFTSGKLGIKGGRSYVH